MIGTVEVNCTGANAKATITGMNTANRERNHEFHCWQHNKLSLVIAALNNNAVVK